MVIYYVDSSLVQGTCALETLKRAVSYLRILRRLNAVYVSNSKLYGTVRRKQPSG